MPCRLYLIRHGQVDPAWHGRIYGARDIPLSAHGRSESADVARRLLAVRMDAVVSSGLSRAEHTAALLRESRGLPRCDDHDLREIERGEWTGLSLDALATRDPEAWKAWLDRPSRVRPPGGESLSDLRARCVPRVASWAEAHADGTVAIVAHGWVLRVLVCEVLGLALDAAPRLDVRTGDLLSITWPTRSPDATPRLDGFALG